MSFDNWWISSLTRNWFWIWIQVLWLVTLQHKKGRLRCWFYCKVEFHLLSLVFMGALVSLQVWLWRRGLSGVWCLCRMSDIFVLFHILLRWSMQNLMLVLPVLWFSKFGYSVTWPLLELWFAYIYKYFLVVRGEGGGLFWNWFWCNKSASVHRRHVVNFDAELSDWFHIVLLGLIDFNYRLWRRGICDVCACVKYQTYPPFFMFFSKNQYRR